MLGSALESGPPRSHTEIEMNEATPYPVCAATTAIQAAFVGQGHTLRRMPGGPTEIEANPARRCPQWKCVTEEDYQAAEAWAEKFEAENPVVDRPALPTAWEEHMATGWRPTRCGACGSHYCRSRFDCARVAPAEWPPEAEVVALIAHWDAWAAAQGA